jgi:hypothetical protein
MSATGDERKLLIETVAKFGPWFVMGIAGIVFVDRRVGEGINVLKENASSQQKLADAVSSIANRDDAILGILYDNQRAQRSRLRW